VTLNRSAAGHGAIVEATGSPGYFDDPPIFVRPRKCPAGDQITGDDK
jgi:hypothetical protein